MIPVHVKQGLINKKEAINKVCECICLNPNDFGLKMYDEDFREDIILKVLERGTLLIDGYDETKSDFFKYIYFKIRSFIHTVHRIKSKKNLESTIKISESANITREKTDIYKTINYSKLEKLESINCPKIPYALKNELTPEELRKTFENVHGDKKLLVVAIKSAYYITDSQVKKVCSHYNIDEDKFLKAIQYCREQLILKAEKKIKVQEKRNSAYIHHKNLETQIYSIKHNMIEKDDFLKNNFIERNAKYRRYWLSLNKQLDDGMLSLRPTNKTIASILGLCERQVAYYISSLRTKNNYNNKYVSGDENITSE